MSSFVAATLSLALAAPPLAAAEPHHVEQALGAADAAVDRPRLRLRTTGLAAIATGALALWAASEVERARDHVTSCRWCEPGAFDLWARHELRWSRSSSAGDASDLLLLAVPLGSAAALASLALADDDAPHAAFEDVIVIAAALSIADPLTSGVKHASGRLRPQAWAAGGPRVDGDLRSFFSGHTSRVFAAAAAATQVARMRGRPGWKWVAAIGFTAAAATGWMRVAADQHWATDVLAGAAVGTATGFGIAGAALRPVDGRKRGVAIVPAPGGLALVF